MTHSTQQSARRGASLPTAPLYELTCATRALSVRSGTAHNREPTAHHPICYRNGTALTLASLREVTRGPRPFCFIVLRTSRPDAIAAARHPATKHIDTEIRGPETILKGQSRRIKPGATARGLACARYRAIWTTEKEMLI